MNIVQYHLLGNGTSKRDSKMKNKMFTSVNSTKLFAEVFTNITSKLLFTEDGAGEHQGLTYFRDFAQMPFGELMVLFIQPAS